MPFDLEMNVSGEGAQETRDDRDARDQRGEVKLANDTLPRVTNTRHLKCQDRSCELKVVVVAKQKRCLGKIIFFKGKK